jgi:GNAT superfamily N-acetyltransferase
MVEIMRILFLHGRTSVPGGRKPTFLSDCGHEVVNPALPDDNFEDSVRIAEREHCANQPDVVVGSSRGGAVAINMDSRDSPLVLLCPAWKNWGLATSVKPNTAILHSRQDDVIPFGDSQELLVASGLPAEALIEVGDDHRLADPESLAAMLEACVRLVRGPDLVDVTVYYLEMLAHSKRGVPAPRTGLTVLSPHTLSVPDYRFLYDSVGSEYNWLSRRKLSDAQLAAILHDPLNEVHILHVDGSPAGFAELDRRESGEIELVQFGLLPDFIGQGLGKWFLDWTIDTAFSYRPKRFWLHTCTLDHSAALPTYKKAGFVLFKEETLREEL